MTNDVGEDMNKPVAFITSLFFGLLIFLGIPLLGWGLGAIAQFFVNPARIAYALVILALQVFALLYNPRVGKSKENRKQGLQQHKIDLVLIQVISLATVFFAPFSDRYSFAVMNYGDTIRLLGFLLVIPAFVVMQMAEKQLDRQFSIQVTLQEGHRLIQSGLYQHIRHPRYLGILVFYVGISVVFRSWLTLLLAAALLVILLWRIQAEEALMKGEFGTEWDAYRARSWRLIPFIF